MSDAVESTKSEMKPYMELKENDPTNHRIYTWVNESYFYKGLERAKVEKLFVNEVGRVDIGKLVQFLWGAWADGRVVALPNHECRKAVMEYISKITSCEAEKVEAVAEMVIDANKPKRKSRAKPKVDEVMAEMSIEDLKENN